MASSIVRRALVAMCGLLCATAALAAQEPRIASGPPAAAPRLVTVHVTKALLRDVLEDVARQARLTLSYRGQPIDDKTRISITIDSVPVTVAFATVLRGTGIEAIVVRGDHAVIAKSLDVAAVQDSTGTIAGEVVDAKTRQPLKGAAVGIDDRHTTRTGNDGKFRLDKIGVGSHPVVVRLIGYVKQTKVVEVTENRATHVDIALEQSVNALDQVVVTGTVAATEIRAIPNAITVITAKQLEERNITHIDQLFRGDVPGLFVQNLGSAPKSSGGQYVKQGAVRMYSRGASVLDSASPPIKTYIDGIELADPDYLNQIDPTSIERIEIIAGPQASTIYGSGALGGVMQIFMKKGKVGQRRPQVAATLQYGMLENNFSSARAPRHNDGLSITDAGGAYAYNLGGTYSYDGQWTPGRYTRSWGGYGGLQRSAGPLNASLSAVFSKQRLGAGGGVAQELISGIEEGRDQYDARLLVPTYGSVYDITHSTLGTSMQYQPWSWWSHSITLGIDQSSNGSSTNGATYATQSDTLNVGFVSSTMQNRTLAYSTTVNHSLGSWLTTVLTVGGRASHSNSLAMTGSGTNRDQLNSGVGDLLQQSRSTSHSEGYFGQGQLGVSNALFFTVGVNGEKNPGYGAKHRIDFTPRYGATAVHEFGDITAKARFAYGRATRVPEAGSADSILQCTYAPLQCAQYTSAYGAGALYQFAAPFLRPESQSGPEGGIDLDFGHRGALSITHYRQAVKDLLAFVVVNELRSPLAVGSTPQYQWQNLGDIANVGWTGNGTLFVGPLTFSGTYSWTRSRVTRLNPLYTGQQSLGSSTLGMAEHTAAFTAQYTSAKTSIVVSVDGVGQILQGRSVSGYYSDPSTRIQSFLYAPNVLNPISVRPIAPSARGMINASRSVSRDVSLFLNIVNVTNKYGNEGDLTQATYPTLGRQTFLGTRIRM